MDIKIESTHLKIGIKGNPPFINVIIKKTSTLLYQYNILNKLKEDLAHLCDRDDSCWCIGIDKEFEKINLRIFITY